jgi:hypothetical protein
MAITVEQFIQPGDMPTASVDMVPGVGRATNCPTHNVSVARAIRLATTIQVGVNRSSWRVIVPERGDHDDWEGGGAGYNGTVRANRA